MFLGGMDPDYVLNRMTPYERSIALDGLYLKHRESWEQTRELFFAQVQVNSKERLRPKEVMPFPWDEKSEVFEEESEEDRMRIERMMEEIVKEKNNGGLSNETVAGE